MEKPLVSIVVRTKDRPKLLKDALRSIADQTYRPIQTVLVNDGGCELDLEEINAILGDKSLNYVRHKVSQGRAAALNVGLQNCEGACIAFLDDDDIYYPSGIAALVKAASDNKAQVVYGQVVCKTWMPGDRETTVVERILGEPFHFGKLLFENYIPVNALLVSSKLIEKTGPFDNDFEIFEDWDWIIRMARLCTPLYIDTIVAEYRIFASSTFTGKGGVQLHRISKERLLRKHIEKAVAGDFLDYVQRVVDNLVIEKGKECVMSIEELTKSKDEKIRSIEERIKSKDEEIMRLMGEEQAIRKALEDILSSHSWKVTRPIRMLGSVTRKLLGMKNNE